MSESTTKSPRIRGRKMLGELVNREVRHQYAAQPAEPSCLREDRVRRSIEGRVDGSPIPRHRLGLFACSPRPNDRGLRHVDPHDAPREHHGVGADSARPDDPRARADARTSFDHDFADATLFVPIADGHSGPEAHPFLEAQRRIGKQGRTDIDLHPVADGNGPARCRGQAHRRAQRADDDVPADLDPPFVVNEGSPEGSRAGADVVAGAQVYRGQPAR